MREVSRPKNSSSGLPLTMIAAAALAQEHAGRGGLATAGAVVLLDRHDGSLELQRLRLLGGVRMFGAGVDLELAEHRAAERVLRQHALHRDFDDALGMRAASSPARARSSGCRRNR